MNPSSWLIIAIGLAFIVMNVLNRLIVRKKFKKLDEHGIPMTFEHVFSKEKRALELLEAHSSQRKLIENTARQIRLAFRLWALLFLVLLLVFLLVAW